VAATRVVHLRSAEWAATPEADRVRVTRPSRWGNPFRVTAALPRDEAIRRYREHLRTRPDLVERARRELRGKVLGCWCAPEPCHGDVLAAVAEGADP
jgi:hypothetical protein